MRARYLILVLVVLFLVGMMVVGVLADGGASDSSSIERKQRVVAKPETIAVATRGILYLFGNRLEPPFVFTMLNDSVWVNDYLMMWDRQPRYRKTRSDSMHDSLNMRIMAAITPMILGGVEHDLVALREAEIVMSSGLADSVRVDRGRLLVWWKGKEYQPEEILVPYEILPPRPQEEELRRKVFIDDIRRLSLALDEECIVLFTGASLTSRRLKEFEERIADLRRRGVVSEEDKQFFSIRGLADQLLRPMVLIKRGKQR